MLHYLEQVACTGNLRPLLNGESLKNWPNGEFEKRMSQIWSIFKQMFENTVHFQKKCETNTPGAASGGAPRALPRPGEGYFFKICLKMDHIFKHLFENGPIFKHLFENGPYLAHPFFKLAIGPVFQTFTI